MRMKGKKVIFNYRDTWDLSETLRPIIAAGLRKFLEVKANPKHSDWFGVPMRLDVARIDASEDVVKEWDDVLNKMLFAFESREPDMSDYDFTLDFVPKEDDELRGSMLVVKGKQSEYDRYREDVDEYHIKRQEGYELFGKYFSSLWW